MFFEYYCPVCDSLVNADTNITIADEKNIVFHWEEKAYKRKRKADTV